MTADLDDVRPYLAQLPARERIRAGGPTSIHRDALSVAGLVVLREMVFARENWRCGWCCSFTELQLEHAVNRSQRGGDLWANCWAVCPTTHKLKDRPYERGRLLIEPWGDGRFTGLYVIGTKAAYRVLQERVFGRLATDEERAILERLA